MVDGDDETSAPPAAAVRGTDVASPFDTTTEFGRAMAAVDWAGTGVGPWQQWPASLLSTVRLLIGSRFAMWMAWGPELTFFCNDKYRHDTLGAKYPWALGRSAREVWSEIWNDVGPRVALVVGDGVSTWDEGLQLFLERSGYVEETYHTFSYSPLTDDDGTITGLLCVVSEDTGRVIGERRMALLRDLGGALTAATTEAEVAAAAQRALATDPYDLPFALVYQFAPETGAAHLAWTTGITAGAAGAPPVVTRADTDLVWHAALFGGDGTSRTDDLTAVPGLPTGGWSEPPTRSIAVPLGRPGDTEPFGYLIAGVNRYRALDEDHRSFFDLITNQLVAAIERSRAFETERDRVERLAELDRAKTTFFTNVSHELRTPLTLLLGPAEDALADRNELLPGAQRGRVEIIHRNGERLLKLVNTLLDFSRLESGRVEAFYEQLDLSRFTAELASMFESAYARAGLSLDIDCEPLPSRPYVDREMWSKIVLNLLSNALKATFTGGATVRLRSDPERDGVLLEVSDTGVGIAEDEQDRLFERFHRVSGAALRTHEGSGIGLALVAELARLHGGEVGVRSSLGHGSTFGVRIPYGTAHLPAGRIGDRAVDEIAGVTQYGVGYLAEALRWLSPTAPTAERVDRSALPHVLVVDDNADMREYVLDLLRERYHVDTAPDGAAALAQIRRNPPDLVLTDVMMPELDGFGLLAAIRDDPQLAHLPVVMLSARSGDDATVEGLEAGADDYLVKPFSARELLARVRANLELDRVRRLVTELERNREVLDNAERLAQIGSWEIDVQRDRMRASAELMRMVGATEQDIASTSLERIVSTFYGREDSAALRAAVDRLLADGTPVDLEVLAYRLDGTQYLARIRAVSVPEADGTRRFIRGSTQDITAARVQERELLAAHAEREVAAREHAIASELQQSLLPARTFDADQLDIAAFYRAGVEGTEVGGDWHDVIDVGAGRTALVIGDVMGRGVRAAAVMGQLRAAVRAYARLDIGPADLLRLLDDVVRDISPDTIVTCVYAVYDPADRTLTYAAAGHLPPLITVPGEPVRRLTAGGPPLGSGGQGEIGETVLMPTGATLTFYTDGLVERRGADLDHGIDRLGELLATSDGPIADLPAALADALLPDGQSDDVAVLVCRVTDTSSGERVATYAVEESHDALVETRRFVADTIQAWGVSDEVLFDVQLAASELTTNAIRHGSAPVQVRIRLRGETLVLEVHDGGRGGPWLRIAAPDEANGRGLLLISRVASRWGTRQLAKGKAVWCQFTLTGPTTAQIAG